MISEFPLFIFTLFTGLSAGLYVATVAFPDPKAFKSRTWVLPLCCLALLGLGLLGALFHLGQPMRFMNALAHPTAPITMEAYCSMAFGALVLADLVVSVAKGSAPKPLRIVAVVAALALMAITGYAYFTCYGIPAWASWPTLIFFIASNLAMGASIPVLANADRARQSRYLWTNLALNAIYLIDLVALAFRFSQFGYGIEWLTAALIVGPVAGSTVLIASRKEGAPRKLSIGFPVLVIAATVVARYTFYAISSI